MEAGLRKMMEKMMNAEPINTTEDRPVLHVALRAHERAKIIVKNKNVVTLVREVLEKLKFFVTRVREAEWHGYSGKPIRDIVNLGIGGSDLGPKMVCEALKPFSRILNVHFVSNVDGSDIYETLKSLNPETTLFVVASKTFTTQETMANARVAKEWVLNRAGFDEAIANHFVAVSTNVEAAVKFGINPENVFEFWNWVGGRYSLWSAIGISIMLAVGMDVFEELLAGAKEMDEHFFSSPIEKNAPVILGLIGIWYNNFWKAQSYAVLPYDEHLRYFPNFLQQLDMESNGKSVTRKGDKVEYETAPIVWGQVGTNGQHAFYQLLHQGTKMVPVDFLVAAESFSPYKDMHDILVANCFAQSEALMRGKSKKQVESELEQMGLKSKKIKKLAQHKVFEGNKPSTTIIYPKLTPRRLGSLIAMYEHKAFVQGVVWDINSFDQWGVELGKVLTQSILNEFKGGKTHQHDASTMALIRYYLKHRAK
ncbi:hypothetical protein CHS0354_000821 [Potamilus streckersoni]|uniref:Glucose-6-phosphate isomerase n=1 Tax=Potamilus streckersoni TaxID=2493646 RepID=A0AAE0T7C9_9BIVA|nr:hypothetical protein CHS0354_000821 [Potamilus streckersoni]